MIRNLIILIWVAVCCAPAAEAPRTVFQVDVDMVVLNLTITDAKGKYVSGLKAEDLRIKEDGIPEKIVRFAEGTSDLFNGTQVFVLFDTSNWMYTGFPYASDAVAEFVRRMHTSDSVAVYKFSRNLFRAVSLTTDHDRALAGVRSAVAGDDTALYNALLLTLRDAAKVGGRKAVVLFSNGPDNASIVAPDDVATVAEDEGIPVYVISTREAQKDELTASAFQRLTARTGGRLFWARTWEKQTAAFSSIREELAGSYTVAYYPAPNPNGSFRSISVELTTDTGKKYTIRTRPGYHPHTHEPSR